MTLLFCFLLRAVGGALPSKSGRTMRQKNSWTSGLAAASSHPHDICVSESGLVMPRGTMAGMKGWAADMGREKQPQRSPQKVRELSRCWHRETRMKAAPDFTRP